MRIMRKGICLLLLLIILSGSLVGCRSTTEKSPAANAEASLDDFETATIGIVTGTAWDPLTQKRFPNAKRKYFNSATDMLLALEQGKIDVFLADNCVFSGMRWESSAITCIDEPVETFTNAMIMAKDDYDPVLMEQINTFIAKSKENGTLATLEEKWFGVAEPSEHPDYTALTGENGTLRVAVSDSMRPVSYQRGSQYTGYEVDFLTLFAHEYGYKLDLEGMAFDALIPYVASGKCDIGASGITITPERMENVTFTAPHFETHGVAVIRNDFYGTPSVPQSIHSPEDLEQSNLAIMIGTIWDGVAQQRFPDAERKYFSSLTDMVLSLDQGKVDAILGDRTFYVTARWENVPVTALDETIGSIACGWMLAKDDESLPLQEQLNAFITHAKQDGTIDALAEKWFSDTEPTEHPDYLSLPAQNGTLKIAVDNTAKPMTYRKNDTFTGFDVELLTLFAAEHGYALEILGMSFDALIPSVVSKKCDIAACGIAITDERAQSVSFTESYLSVDGVVIVRLDTAQDEQPSLWQRVTESFDKTFVREDRWKLILEGIGVTILISICATICGSLLGFGLYLLSRSDIQPLRAAARIVARVYSRMIAGTPVVVILMILFYVIFGKLRDISGIVVAIIGFTLTFGAFVYEHMVVSIGSVDRGQTEAALALGYTKNSAFFHILFPQAMKIFLPSYCAQAVELIKATAVVGYIAVNDLTKMGDIIRSNTYEAFFPLIATAAIYFLLTWGLACLLNLVKAHFDPKRRSKDEILRGVRTL